MTEITSERTDEQMLEYTNGRMSERITNKRMDEWTSDRKNERAMLMHSKNTSQPPTIYDCDNINKYIYIYIYIYICLDVLIFFVILVRSFASAWPSCAGSHLVEEGDPGGDQFDDFAWDVLEEEMPTSQEDTANVSNANRTRWEPC